MVLKKILIISRLRISIAEWEGGFAGYTGTGGKKKKAGGGGYLPCRLFFGFTLVLLSLIVN